MTFTTAFLRAARRHSRHIAAALIVSLQLGVATSAVWEGRAERRLDTHVEENGTRHLDQHNEDTCALCSVRTQTPMPADLADRVVAGGEAGVGPAGSHRSVPSAQARTTLSRAPPALQS